MFAVRGFANTAPQGVVLVVGHLLELFCALLYLEFFYTDQLLADVVVIAGLQFCPLPRSSAMRLL
ncbi:hypothetical protein [Microbulbifer epialgicus]|uniref:Uncharacterized protein n=1 Tax=Microbulbifer epialgicus TaxID=393907 RepID=A0ABV4P296_9GAMM